MSTTVNVLSSFWVDSANSCLNTIDVPTHNTGPIISLRSHLSNGQANFIKLFQKLICQRFCGSAILCSNKSDEIFSDIMLSSLYLVHKPEEQRNLFIQTNICGPLGDECKTLCSRAVGSGMSRSSFWISGLVYLAVGLACSR